MLGKSFFVEGNFAVLKNDNKSVKYCTLDPILFVVLNYEMHFIGSPQSLGQKKQLLRCCIIAWVPNGQLDFPLSKITAT